MNTYVSNKAVSGFIDWSLFVHTQDLQHTKLSLFMGEEINVYIFHLATVSKHVFR
jgi:hypothetical protein